MKRIHTGYRLIYAAICFSLLPAQTIQAQDPSEFSIVKDASESGLTLEWTSQAQTTYFIQYSSDLQQWDYLPLIEQGNSYGHIWNIDSNADKLFFRLKYTDALPSNEDPFEYDFDGDSVSNLDELSQGTDPFSNTDANGNLVPDDWETFYSVSDLSADEDQDGLTALQEYQNGSSPSDYFNGELPNFVQVASETDTLSMRVTLKSDDSVLVNAPVRFRAVVGGHLLAASPSGEKHPELTIRTGTDGIAKVYLVAP
jgi:hypothetical protein